MRADENFFSIDGVKSSEYGVYCSGGGTFSAPSRDMTAVSIPGKNGDLLIDNGRYNNVDVVYDSWIARDLDGKIDAFRSWLMTQTGYHKISDSYHPDEYRLGAVGEFAPEMGTRNRSSRFDVTFNCKPQRYIVEGDEWLAMIPTHLEDDTLTTAYRLAESDALKLSFLSSRTRSVTIEAKGRVSGVFTQTVNLTAGVPAVFSFDMSGLTGGALWRLSYANDNELHELSVGVDGGAMTPVGKITLSNPTGYTALPIIRFFRGATDTNHIKYRLRAGAVVYTVSALANISHNTEYHIDVDSGLQDCYFSREGFKTVNCNPNVTIDSGTEFAIFPAGEITLRSIRKKGQDDDLNGYSPFTYVYIKPRWWRL